MAVNWTNVQERVLSTFTQAVIGALSVAAEYVAAHGVADWKTGLVAVGVPALLSLAKNLQVELARDLKDFGATDAQVQAVTDAERQAADALRAKLAEQQAPPA